MRLVAGHQLIDTYVQGLISHDITIIHHSIVSSQLRLNTYESNNMSHHQQVVVNTPPKALNQTTAKHHAQLCTAPRLASTSQGVGTKAGGNGSLREAEDGSTIPVLLSRANRPACPEGQFRCRTLQNVLGQFGVIHRTGNTISGHTKYRCLRPFLFTSSYSWWKWPRYAPLSD